MCKFYKFLYWLIPIKRFKSVLIRKHFANCSKCQREIEIEDRLKKILITPDKVREEGSLWPKIKLKLYTPEKVESKQGVKLSFLTIKKWQWVLAVFLVLIVTVISITYKNLPIFQKSVEIKKDISPLETRVIVEFAKVKNKPAKVYIFQSKNRKMSIIWIEPYNSTGG